MKSPDEARPSALPERIGGLAPLSQNLWWSWQPDAEELYRVLDPLLFESVSENPVLMLRVIAPERLRQAAADPAYLARYDAVMARFAQLSAENPARTWLGEHQAPKVGKAMAV